MKLRLLAAASAIAIGGAAFAVYRETRPDTAAAAAGSPTPVERAPSSSVPRADEPTAPVAPVPATSPTSGARTATTPAPALPAPADRDERAAAISSPPQPPAGSAVTTRAGVTSIKPPVRRDTEHFEPGSPEAAIVRQKRMNRTLESAACHAPDIEKRYNQLPENERAALRARCAKYGVTLGDPG